MSFTKLLCLILIIVSFNVLVENRSYNNGLVFYNLANERAYLPPTISASRGRGLAKFKYSPRGSIWSTFGKPCDCSGPLCGCCVGIKVKQYNFDQKICANVSYVAPKDEIQLEVFLNETSTAKYGVAARNPSPLCIPIMMGIPMSMCVQMSNIAVQGDNLNMCMDFLVRLASTELFEMHFQCMRVGLQGVSWVGASGQPVIPPSESKIKDRNGEESDEYYDEQVDDTENEVISKEKDFENANEKLTVNNEEEDKNKAEEEMDYNDITDKISHKIKEKENERETLQESEKDLIDNEVSNTDIKEEFLEDQLSLSTEESKIDNIENIMKKPTAPQQNEGDKKEEDEIKQEIQNELKENILVTTEESKPMAIDSEEFDDYSDEIQTGHESIPTTQQLSSDETILGLSENNENDLNDLADLEILTNAPDCSKEIANMDDENQNMKHIPEAFPTINETEKLQSEKEDSLEVERFDMLTNIKEELPQKESELNNSKEILNVQLDMPTTEHVIAVNFKPTITAITTTSETNNIENVDNAITTATIMTTTIATPTPTTTTKTLFATNAAAAAATFIENNNSNISNDSDKSQNNDSDYEDEESYEENDEEEEKDVEKEEEVANDEVIDNKDTITTKTPSKENVSENKDNQENLSDDDEKRAEESTTMNNSNALLSNESITSEESTANELTNKSFSNESNTDDAESYGDEQDEYDDEEEEEKEEMHEEEVDDEEVDDEDISDSYEDERNTETTAITFANEDISMATIVNVSNNHISNKSLTTSSTANNTKTLNPPLSTVNLSLNSSISISVATDNSKSNSTAPINMSQTTTTTIIPLPLARRLFTLHRHNRRRLH